MSMSNTEKVVKDIRRKTRRKFSTEEKIEVMEGSWNFSGVLVIEKLPSMAALKRFWNSEEYQEVKKLRAGITETNFFVAIEGPPES